MQVALVLRQFDPRRGGLEQWTSRFAERLHQRGHEVHVVAQRFGPTCPRAAVVPHLVEGNSPMVFAEAAQARLMALAPDVIHDMGAGWYCDVFHPHGGSWVSVTRRKQDMAPPWLRGVKRRVDGLLPRHRRYRRLSARQYADSGQLMLALSQAVADDFRCLHGVPNERIRLVYNGVDTQHFSPEHRRQWREPLRQRLGLDNQAVLALIVAHNFRLKGVPTLLRAMRRFRGRRCPLHLVVVGGKRLVRWQMAAAGMGLGRQVHFMGSVDDPRPYYAAADFYVHPTIYDTCSLVVLEAAASGLPVVTTRANGVSELLKHRADSLLLNDPLDDAGLADSMRFLLDETQRARFGSAARQIALSHTLDRNVDDVLAVYQDAIAMRQTFQREPVANRQRPTGHGAGQSKQAVAG